MISLVFLKLGPCSRTLQQLSFKKRFFFKTKCVFCMICWVRNAQGVKMLTRHATRCPPTHQFFFSVWTTLTRTCSPPRANCSPAESRHTRVKWPSWPSVPSCRPVTNTGLKVRIPKTALSNKKKKTYRLTKSVPRINTRLSPEVAEKTWPSQSATKLPVSLSFTLITAQRCSPLAKRAPGQKYAVISWCRDLP